MLALIVYEVSCLILVLHNIWISVALQLVLRARAQSCPFTPPTPTNPSSSSSVHALFLDDALSGILTRPADLDDTSDDDLSPTPESDAEESRHSSSSIDPAFEASSYATVDVDTTPLEEEYSPASSATSAIESDLPLTNATTESLSPSTNYLPEPSEMAEPTTPRLPSPPHSTSACKTNAIDGPVPPPEQKAYTSSDESQRIPSLTRSIRTLPSGSDTSTTSSFESGKDDLVLVPNNHPPGLPLMDNFPGRHMKFIDDYDSFGPKPGPFGIIGSLDPGSCGMVLAARELSPAEKWSDPKKASRVFCLKTFEKKDSVKVGYIHLVLQELRAYQTWYTRGKGTWGSMFVMDLHAALQDEYRFYLVMEMMACDLLSVFSTDPDVIQFRQDNKTRWIAQIAAGLHSLHKAGIIHRDMKPENVLLDNRCNIRITDLGSAHISTATNLRREEEYSTTVLGTWPYLAPEVLDLKNTVVTGITTPYGPAVDWWALGCMIFELETELGEPLFTTEDDLRDYQWHQVSPDGEGRSWWKRHGLRSDVESVITGLLRIDPVTRYDLSDLREEPYFTTWFGSPDACIFDDIEEEAMSQEPDLNSLRKWHVKQVTDVIHPTLNNKRYNGTKYTIKNFCWANPDGHWGKSFF